MIVSKEFLKSKLYNDDGKAISARFTEKWISEIYPDFHSAILKDTEKFTELSYNQRVLIWVKDIIRDNTCKSCGSDLIKIYRGDWAEYCSRKCAQNDPEVKRKMVDNRTVSYEESIDKRNKTLEERYGPRKPKPKVTPKKSKPVDVVYSAPVLCDDIIKEQYIQNQTELFNFIKENSNSSVYVEWLSPLKRKISTESGLSIVLKSCYFDSDIIQERKRNDSTIYIWDDEWINNKTKVRNFILNKLNKTSRIGARKTKVVELSQDDYAKFLDTHHMQGSTTTKHRLGLIHNGEILSVMGFSNIQSNREKLLAYGENGYELTRFANKNVVGAFDKLLSHFLKNNVVGFISSFADLEIVSEVNNIYLSNGFTEAYRIKPDYKYFVPSENRRSHKFNFRKNRFAKMGFDIEGKTERDLAEEAGILRCFDLGKIQYIKILE